MIVASVNFVYTVVMGLFASDNTRSVRKLQRIADLVVALEEEYAALVSENESLRAEIAELRDFKLNIENEKKDKLIASYHMLSDEDKADVIAHKSEYSLDEIKAKLAVIYVEKNVNFDMIDGQEEVESESETAPAMTFSLDEEASESVPAFLEALRQTKNF